MWDQRVAKPKNKNTTIINERLTMKGALKLQPRWIITDCATQIHDNLEFSLQGKRVILILVIIY
jgi:molybdopterin-biosynthesis enzyme MoeA-like protein